VARERAFPHGWFRVASSADVAAGVTRKALAGGRELVLFRTGQGALGVVDPHCPHLGAHLGHGGCVVGETLRCPFHGFRYTVDGACAGADGRDGDIKLRLGAWPALDWNGQVMVYLSDDRRAPSWQLPLFEQRGFSEPFWQTLHLLGHVQDAAENGVDLGHFGAVHGYSNVRDACIEADGVRLHTRFAFDRQNPLGFGTISSVFDTDIYGLGCSITRLVVEDWRLHARLLLLATQIDASAFDFTIGLQIEYPEVLQGARGVFARTRDLGAAAGARLLMRYVIHDVLQDREIWAHRRYLEHPGLVAGDGSLGMFRRYVRQFYASEDSDEQVPAGNRRLALASRGVATDIPSR